MFFEQSLYLRMQGVRGVSYLPVEAHLDHVVPPDVGVDGVMRVVVPAVLDKKKKVNIRLKPI